MTPRWSDWSTASAKTSYFEILPSRVLRAGQLFASASAGTAAIGLSLQGNNLPAVATATLATGLLLFLALQSPRYSMLSSREFHDWTLLCRRSQQLEQRELLDCYCSRWLVCLRFGREAGHRFSLPVTVVLPADALTPEAHRRMRIGLLRLGR